MFFKFFLTNNSLFNLIIFNKKQIFSLYSLLNKNTNFFFYKFFNFNFYINNNINKVILPITNFSYFSFKNKLLYLNIIYYYNCISNLTNFIYNETLNNGFIYIYSNKLESINSYFYLYRLSNNIIPNTNINKIICLLKNKKIFSIFFFQDLVKQEEVQLKNKTNLIGTTLGFSSLYSTTNFTVNMLIPKLNFAYKYIYYLHFINISIIAIRQRKFNFLNLYFKNFKKISYLCNLI